MTVFTQPGWLQNAGTVHTAEQMRNYALSLLLAGSAGATSMQGRGGVHPGLGNELQVTQTGSPSMAVIVKSGLCAIPGTEGGTQGIYGLGNDGDVTLSIDAAHATLPRIDIVVARIRDSAYSGVDDEGVLEVVTGTAASSPVAPTTPDNSLVLAQVAVAAGDTSITTGEITDVRKFLAGVGGFIRAKSTDSFTGLLHVGQPVYMEDTGQVGIATDTGATLKTLISGINIQTFTASGTWTKPPGANYVKIFAKAGGGGGAGAAAAASGQNTKGGGGGEGSWSESTLLASALTATVAVTVGAGGAGGVAGAGGSTGGATTFGAYVTTNAGLGGSTAASSATAYGAPGGAGGAAGTGQLAMPGAPGGMAWGDTTLSMSGPGGGSGGGIGRSASSSPTSTNGVAGAANSGGGGSGGISTSTAAAANGGAGGSGQVYVVSYV